MASRHTPVGSASWRAGRHRFKILSALAPAKAAVLRTLEIRGADDEAEPSGTSSEATVEREESAVE